MPPIVRGVKLWFIFILLLAGGAATELRAQTNWLTLAEARRQALERNWDFLAARSGVDAATAAALMAREFPNPNLSASTAKIGNRENATPAGNGIWARSYDTIFAVNQLLEIGGKRRDRQRAAQAGVMGAKARLADARRLLEQGVTRAYIAAALAGTNAGILRESAGYLQHEAQLAEFRWHAGDLARADYQPMAVAAGQYELQAAAAETAARQARIAVEILLGVRQPEGNWLPAETLDQLRQMLAAPAPVRASTTISNQRPDVRAAEADLQSAEASLQLQRALRIPDPTVAVQFEHNPPGGGPPTDTIGLGVSFPLPLWNLNQGAIAQARAAREQSRLAMEKARAQAAGDLASARAESAEATARWQRYHDQIGPQSAAARDAIGFKYEKGGAALVDLLEAERTDNDVRIATAQALADTLTAAADLVASQTVLTEADLPWNHE